MTEENRTYITHLKAANIKGVRVVYGKSDCC